MSAPQAPAANPSRSEARGATALSPFHRALLLIWGLLVASGAWYGVGVYGGWATSRQLDDAASALARSVGDTLGRLQTRVLIENGRLADERTSVSEVARSVASDLNFVTRVETRDKVGRLQRHADIGANGEPRDQLNPGQLMSFYSASGSNSVVLSSPYPVREANGATRSFIDLFSPVGRGENAFLVVTFPLDRMLDFAIAQLPPAGKRGFSFALVEAGQRQTLESEKPGGGAEVGMLTRSVEVNPGAGLGLMLQARSTAIPSPELQLLRWVLSLLAGAIAILVPLQIRAGIHRRRAQREYRLLEEKLEREARFATLGEMSVAIAHELNQPLAAIENFAFTCERLLQRPNLAPEELKFGLGEIRAQARRSAEVIRSIRQFVKRKESPAALVDVKDVLGSLRLMLEIQATSLGCKLDIETEEGTRLFCNRSMLEQVILNLARNGFEAMATMEGSKPDTRLLQIRAGKREPSADEPRRTIAITVADKGPGIKPEVAATLFKPFSSTKENGLGIGLSLCLSMVERQGGSLRWHNNTDGGATFTIQLPVAEQRSEAPALAADALHSLQHGAGARS